MQGDLHGRVPEAGLGTGRNFRHYHESVELAGVVPGDACGKEPLKKAGQARCRIEPLHDDAGVTRPRDANRQDWLVSTLRGRVMPDEFQRMARVQFGRVLKPAAGSNCPGRSIQVQEAKAAPGFFRAFDRQGLWGTV